MGLYEYFMTFWNSLLSSLGLKNKEGTLLLLGLDNAGKTTLLHRLRTGGVRSFPPTDRPYQTEKFICQGITFQAWDLGGHEAVRHLWQDYVCECKAVLFLVDASDIERMEEVSYELDSLIEEGVLQDLPVALVFNKCDLPTALPSTEILKTLNYDTLSSVQGEDKMKAFRISVLKGEGHQDVFRWVSSFL